MLQMLAELYATCPEEGDMDKPKLVMFIDEAHLIFQDASEAPCCSRLKPFKAHPLKGGGIFFCTQNPMDVPASVLAQLGLKVQHVAGIHTAADRKVIKAKYPRTTRNRIYKTKKLPSYGYRGSAGDHAE